MVIHVSIHRVFMPLELEEPLIELNDRSQRNAAGCNVDKTAFLPSVVAFFTGHDLAPFNPYFDDMKPILIVTAIRS